jgi:bifunctional non-homologous end joining protein LigD
MDLKKYWSKRNFKKTTEPAGKVGKEKSKKLIYIVQKHAASHLHYDFRLELGGVLLSWAVPKGPCLDPQVKRLAMQTEDHPIEYAKFEGTIPKGEYGGGNVILWDKGEWTPVDEDPVAAYKRGDLKFTLKAEKLNGLWKLIKIKNDDKAWLLIKGKDEEARPLKDYDIIEQSPLSVISGLDVTEISEQPSKLFKAKQTKKAKSKVSASSKQKLRVKVKVEDDYVKSNFPKTFLPQLATLSNKPPMGDEWVHEIKFDGYRFLAFKKNNKTTLISRNGKDWSAKFKDVIEAVNQLPIENVILDGEIVVLDDDHKSNFQLLQNAIKEADRDFIYYLFDIVYYDKFDVSQLPLLKRKEILQQLVPDATGEILRYSEHIIGDGNDLLRNACQLSLEGIISKDINSPYLQKRTKSWLKSKCNKRQEFIICGYTEPQKTRQYFGALLLGTYDNKKNLIYHGNVGTGFDGKLLKDIYKSLQKIVTKTPPFEKVPKGLKTVTWVKPILVAEIEFTEWTSENSLRHPSFKGMRLDKPASHITKETTTPIETIIKPKKITKSKKIPHKALKLASLISNPTKIMYEEDNITKSEIATYYESIQSWILPYIINRPLSLLRCPDGYKKCFYQKHLTDSKAKDLYSVKIKENKTTEDCIYIKDAEGLISLVQMGVLEIHPWGSTVENLEHPDIIIFDLDPSPEIVWKDVVKAALEVKQHLEDFQLKSYVKTTGGKGLHVVVPILPEYSWDNIKNFTQVFADFMVQTYPNKYVAKMSKELRKGKIFIDYLRNQRGATAVAPYSTRARIHAPVSTPIAWEELTKNLDDTSYNIYSVAKKIVKNKKNPWQDFFKIKQSLRIKDFQ